MSTFSLEQHGFSLFVATTSLVMVATNFLRFKWKAKQSISNQSITLVSTDADNNNQNAYSILIGNTPLIKLHRLSAIIKRDIFVKCEHLNPGGTGKDRAVKRMLEEARSHPNYKPGCVIVEGSSGSTGISLAAQVLTPFVLHYF